MLGIVDGPAISNTKGDALSSNQINNLFIKALIEASETEPHLFPVDILNQIEAGESPRTILEQNHACYRSFRRTSDSRALEFQYRLLKDDIDIINRWQATEKSKGKRPGASMRQHYAEVEVLLRPFLRYKAAM